MAELIVTAIFRRGKKEVHARALLDTGAEVTLLSDDLARKLKLPTQSGGGILGAGGRVSLRIARIDSIRIAATRCEARNMMLLVYNERAFPVGGLTGLDSIIGLDFMQQARMRINVFGKSRLVECQT